MQAEIGCHPFQQNPSRDHKVATSDKSKASDIFPEILSKAGFEPKEYGLVLVKPNLCGMYHPQPQLIERTLRFFEPRAQRIVIGETDSMGHTPKGQFRRLGICDMLKRFEGKVEAVNLMEDEILDLEVPSPQAVSHLPIPELVHSCDLLVNILKVGTHSRTMLTCALKNLFGLLAEKRKYGVYHPLGVDKVIADLAKVVRCDLNVVGARDKVIVGVDPLPVDILAGIVFQSILESLILAPIPVCVLEKVSVGVHEGRLIYEILDSINVPEIHVFS